MLFLHHDYLAEYRVDQGRWPNSFAEIDAYLKRKGAPWSDYLPMYHALRPVLRQVKVSASHFEGQVIFSDGYTRTVDADLPIDEAR